MGTYGQSVTLANSIIGVGILAMPFCFQQCGVILATLMLLCSGLVSRLACHFLLKSAIMSRRRNFEFLAFHVFGSTGKFAVEIGIIGFLMGTCIAYFVVVGDLGPQIIAKMFNINQSDVLRSSVMVVVSVVCVLPLGLLRNVDSLGNVSAATIGFYMCLVLKIIAEAASQIFAGDWLTKVDFWKPEGLLQCVPIFSMALFCQTQLFEIFEPLPTISLDKMNVVTKNAINICTSVYILVGLFGYVSFNSQPISGNILVNMSETMASDVIKIGFVMSLAFSFPLIIFPCRASLYSLLYRRGYTPHYEALNHPIPTYRFRVLTLVIVCVSLLVSLAVPNVALVLGLLGSTVGVSVCVIFPATCFVCISLKNTNERILAQVILCFGILMMVLGTYANLQAAELQLHTHTPPVVQHIQNNEVKIVNEDALKPKILHEIKENIIPDESESLIQPPNPIAPLADTIVELAKVDSLKPSEKTPPDNSDDSFFNPHEPVVSKVDSEVQPKYPVPPDSDSEIQPKNPIPPNSVLEVHPQKPVVPIKELQSPNSKSGSDVQNPVPDSKIVPVLPNLDTMGNLAVKPSKIEISNDDQLNINKIPKPIEVKLKEDIMIPKVVIGDKQESFNNKLPFKKESRDNKTDINIEVRTSAEQKNKPMKENFDAIVQNAIANEVKLEKIKQESLIETMKKQGEEQKEILQEQKKILKEIQESLQSDKDKKNAQDTEETKKQAVESIQKIANLAIKRLGEFTNKATTPIQEIDPKNGLSNPKDNQLDTGAQDIHLNKHIHKPDEPESYVHGEEAEKAKQEEEIRMSAANMEAIVNKVPIPIALRQNQHETDQNVRNSRDAIPDNGAERDHPKKLMIMQDLKEDIEQKHFEKENELKLLQGNRLEDNEAKESHSIQKREVIDCTLLSKISEDDKRICKTIMSLKDNSNEGVDLKLPHKLSMPNADSVLPEVKSGDSLNSVMLNNIDLVKFKTRNLKSTGEEKKSR